MHFAPRVPGRAWTALSAAGIAWGFAHLAVEGPLSAGGSNLWKAILAVTILWLAVLLLGVRGSRWAALGTALLGATACYQLALVHFARVGSHTVWLGLLPWMTDPEDAPAWLVPPYNLLMYVGVVLGLAIVWAGTRAQISGDARGRLWIPLAVVVLVSAGGLADMTRPASYVAGTAFIWTGVAALAAGAVAVAAVVVPCRTSFSIRNRSGGVTRPNS
jgi:hypothetical protein